MNDWKRIDIPFKMKDLPKDKRGYPIPFTIKGDANGKADFSQHDSNRLAESIINKQCSICGKPLDSDIWLLAGAKIALDQRGAYIDPPMHKQCATYALKVCPYLALPSFLKRSPKEVNESDPVKLLSGKPVVFALVKTYNYQVHFYPNSTTVIMPVRPFLDIEFWKEGRQISPGQAAMLLK